jgi:hypothetical protein
MVLVPVCVALETPPSVTSALTSRGSTLVGCTTSTTVAVFGFVVVPAGMLPNGHEATSEVVLLVKTHFFVLSNIGMLFGRKVTDNFVSAAEAEPEFLTVNV